jgi:hypothetical protein
MTINKNKKFKKFKIFFSYNFFKYIYLFLAKIIIKN